MNQGAVDVLDLNTALDETLRSLLDQAVVGVFRDRKIQSPLNGLSLRLRVQSSLGALNLGRVQLKVFVGSLGCCRHEIVPRYCEYITMYKVPISMYINCRGLYSEPGRLRPMAFMSHCRGCVPGAGEVLGPESASLPLWSAIRKPFTLTVCRLPVLVTGASKTLGWALYGNLRKTSIGTARRVHCPVGNN